jgi:Sec-independent protein secretion pathway component TatC
MVSWEHVWKVLLHMGIKEKKSMVVFELYMIATLLFFGLLFLLYLLMPILIQFMLEI